MTVNDLRVLIADLDGQMPVLIPAEDHSYRVPVAGVADVWDKGPAYRVARFDECNNKGNTNAQALVVSAG